MATLASKTPEEPLERAGTTALPRGSRLLKPSDFKKVFRKNLAFTDRFFRILVTEGGATDSRLGMAVSKKVDSRAVGRNRIKRVIRESFRHWRAQPDVSTGRRVDIVVLARPAAAAAENRQLFRSLDGHWSRVERAVNEMNVPVGRISRNRTDGKS